MPALFPRGIKPPAFLGIDPQSEQANGLVGWYDIYGHESAGGVIRDRTKRTGDGSIATLGVQHWGGEPGLDSFGQGSNPAIDIDQAIPYLELTMSCRYYLRQAIAGGSQYYLMGVQSGGSDGGRFLRFRGDLVGDPLEFEVIGSSTKDVRSSSLPGIKQWVNVTVTMSDSADESKMYINGQLQNTTSLAGITYSAQLANFALFKRADGGNYFIYGAARDFRVYDRALNAAEIRDIYENPYDLWLRPSIAMEYTAPPAPSFSPAWGYYRANG